MSPINAGEGASPNTWKFVFIAAVFLVTFISSILPLRIVSNLRNAIDPERRTRYARFISILNCFGGGVFLGTAFLDLLPNVISLIHDAFPNTAFPFAEFFITFGFLAILTAEQVAIDCKERESDCRNPIERLQTRNVQLEQETLTVNAQLQEESVQGRITPLPQPEENSGRTSSSVFHSLFLVVALSLHSFFEGLGIGLSESLDVVLQISVAVLIHKVPVAFSIGLMLVQCELKIPAIIRLNLWFSLMSPLGAGIGIILATFKPTSSFNLLNGILVGLTTGTFIFVVFFEILPKELKQGKGRVLNLLFIIIGFSCVCIAVLIEAGHPPKAKLNL